ncbi:MAG: response regulator [Saprospiraceae bacterium]|nr:response regulator [Saprospiraceae bacterium]
MFSLICQVIIQIQPMYLRSNLILILLLGYQFLCFGQNDSLQNLILHTPDDTNKVNLYNELAFSYLYSDRNEAQNLTDTAISLSEKLNFGKGIREAKYIKATAFHYSGDDARSLSMHEALQKECEEVNDPYNLARSLNSSSFIYQNKFELDKALECAQRSLAIVESLGDERRAAIANHTIASVYSLLREEETSRRYLEKSGQLFKKIGDDYRYGVVLQSMAAVTKGQEAIDYAREGLKALKKTDDLQGQGMCYWAIGDGHFELKQYELAIQEFQNALEIFDEIKFEEGIIHMNAMLGLTHTFLGNFERAIEHLAITASNPVLKDIPDSSVPYYRGMAQYYAGINDVTRSIRYIDSLVIMQDSLFSTEKAEQLVVTEARLQTSEKEAQLVQQELELQKRTNSRNLVLITSIISILGLITLLLVLRSRQRRKQKETEYEITLERAKAEQLEEMDKMKSNFFANISHEFRTPLTLLQGPLNQMRKGEFTGDRTKYYDIMYRNVVRLKELINQLLDLSKLEQKRAELILMAVDVFHFSKQLAGTIQSWAEQKNINYHIDIPNRECWVKLDKDKYEKIIMNLLSNAMKYTPEGGEVIFSIKNAAQDNLEILDIQVADSGIGIQNEDKEQIFERYYNGNNQIDGNSSTGIGLALTRELIHLFGGKIDVKSEPGKGSTFAVHLPLPKSEEQATDNRHIYSEVPINAIVHGEPQIAFDSANDPRKKILIVEDNPDVRQYIIDNLEENFICLVAGNGQEGIDKAVEYIPDLIISDVMMPVKDGIQMVNELKTEIKTNHVPVIMLTAKADQKDKIEGLVSGADDYLTKPFDREELIVRINNLIKSRELLQEKFKSAFNLRPSEMLVDSAQQKFLESVREVIHQNIENEQFSVEYLAREVGFSRSQLHRKLKALIDKGPNELIREFRLIRAKNLLDQKYGTISEVAYATGFNNLSYFSKAFKSHFGFPPSEN